MFNFIKSTLQIIYNQFTTKAAVLFGRSTIDESVLEELEIMLIEADTGVKTTRSIMQELRNRVTNGTVKAGTDLKSALEELLLAMVTAKKAPTDCTVYLLVGINGSGKTTFAGKLAHQLKAQGKKVLMVAADTFRAAAPEQLQQWANRSGAQLILGKENQDPASVVFTGTQIYVKDRYDALIIDTAGRLQTKVNLMKELEKIKKIVNKQLPDHRICTLLTIDAMLGQNSFDQAQTFHEATNLDGIVLTKIDGTGKGGIVFAIMQSLGIPVAYLSYGEKIDQLKPFNAPEYVQNLLSGE